MPSQTGTDGWRASYRESGLIPKNMSSVTTLMDGCRFSNKIMLEQKDRLGTRSTALIRRWRRQQIAKPAHRLDNIDSQLLADAADEHLNGIGVAVEILIVEMLNQFGARNHPPGVVHEVGQQPVLVRRHLDRIA